MPSHNGRQHTLTVWGGNAQNCSHSLIKSQSALPAHRWINAEGLKSSQNEKDSQYYSMGLIHTVIKHMHLHPWKPATRLNGRNSAQQGFISRRKATLQVVLSIRWQFQLSGNTDKMLKHLSIQRGFKFQECHVFDIWHSKPTGDIISYYNFIIYIITLLKH